MKTEHFAEHAEGGRRRRLRDLEMEEKILEHFQSNPTTSTGYAVRVLHLSQITVWEVLHDNGQHPFLVQGVQELNTEYHSRRVQFASGFYIKKLNYLVFHQKSYSQTKYHYARRNG